MSIRFRIDAQLPARLAVELQDAGHAAEHVAQLPVGMHLSDQVIWTKSAADGCCIMTKDQDFIDRALVHGLPPQVVHIRLGNCSNIELVTQIRQSLPLYRGTPVQTRLRLGRPRPRCHRDAPRLATLRVTLPWTPSKPL